MTTNINKGHKIKEPKCKKDTKYRCHAYSTRDWGFIYHKFSFLLPAYCNLSLFLASSSAFVLIFGVEPTAYDPKTKQKTSQAKIHTFVHKGSEGPPKLMEVTFDNTQGSFGLVTRYCFEIFERHD